ncbi:MAG: hypothetical protein ACREVI_14110 [Steroidobacteraceae bacterium]
MPVPRLAAFLAAALAPALAAAADQPPLHDVTIRLFEQADAAVLPLARRLYSTHFDATRTRMLGVEIAAGYAAPEEALQVPVSCTMKRPDGSEAASPRPMTFQLFAGSTQSSSANLLWGVAPEEDWAPGSYQVRCLVDDKEIGQTPFEVQLNPADFAQAEIRVASMRLFPVDSELPARADRKYTLELDAGATRRIGVELEFTHAPLGRAMQIPVECYYLWPDGQTSPPLVLRYEPQAAWPGGYSAGAMGWDETGNWPQGVYTVACMSHGRPVAIDRFEVR